MQAIQVKVTRVASYKPVVWYEPRKPTFVAPLFLFFFYSITNDPLSAPRGDTRVQPFVATRLDLHSAWRAERRSVDSLIGEAKGAVIAVHVENSKLREPSTLM